MTGPPYGRNGARRVPSKEMRAIQRDENMFLGDSFERKKTDKEGVEKIVGRKTDGAEETYAYAFDASMFDMGQVHEYLDAHGLANMTIEQVDSIGPDDLESATGDSSGIQGENMLDSPAGVQGENMLDTIAGPIPAAKKDSRRAWTIRFDSKPSGSKRGVYRVDDVALLNAPTITDEGFVCLDGVITRSGVFTYYPDGREFRELRPPDEVLKADSLATFEGKPVTLDHPPPGVDVTPENSTQYQVGTAGTPRVMPLGKVAASLMLHRQDAIEAVRGGKTGLSCGYHCDLIERSGEYVDQTGRAERFDGVQYNIRGNHIAICDTPRAGDEARLRVDGGGGMVDVVVNGQRYRVPEAVARQMRTDAGRLAVASAPVKRVDAAEAARAMLQLRTEAAKVLRCDASELLSKSDSEVKIEVIKHVNPSLNLANADPSYIEGAYGAAVAAARQSAYDSVFVAPQTQRLDAIGQAQSDMRHYYANLWRGDSN